MSNHSDLLPRYKQLRKAGLELNNKLVKSIPTDVLQEGGKKLGILRKGTFVFETEDETSVLMDYCLHDVRRQGRNVIERYLADSPPPADSDEMVILQAKINSWYSIFVIESIERGVGVEVRDLLRDESQFVMDVGFSQSGRVGVVFASRLQRADGMTMTTGAGLPVGLATRAEQSQLAEGFKEGFPGVDFRNMTAEQTSNLATVVIRNGLRRGAASQIGYEDVELGAPANRLETPPRSPRVGRNDPRPCGSGKKVKKCCGARV